jgi:integrase
VAAANKARRVLISAMKQAVKWQLVPRNPIEAVSAYQETRRELSLWTPQDAARFLDTARSHRLYALFYLGMATGLRRGELLGLRWDDITGNVLHVKQTLVKAKGKLVLSTPKTAKGTRRVSLARCARGAATTPSTPRRRASIFVA